MKKNTSLESWICQKIYTRPTISLRKLFRLSDDMANKLQELKIRATLEDSVFSALKYKQKVLQKTNDSF